MHVPESRVSFSVNVVTGTALYTIMKTLCIKYFLKLVTT